MALARSADLRMEISGCAATVRAALAVEPPSAAGPAATTALVVLVILPALVTLIETWQVAPAARDATENRTLVSPAAEAAPVVLVTTPQADGAKLKPMLCSLSPEGKMSSTCTPVMGARVPGFEAGLPTVRVMLEVPPGGMLAGAKLLV